MSDLEVRDWREAPIIQQLSHMLHHNIRTDCSFVVGNQTFRCHKLILSRASAVLDAMLYAPTASTEDIIVKDVLPDTFQTFLEYIYTDEVQLRNVTHAMALCELANMHGMLRLQTICADYICTHLQPQIFWTVLEFAMFLEKPSNFKEKCLEYLQANTLACLEEENFVHTSQAAVSLLLEQEYMNINSELDLIHATGRWAAHEAARLYGPQFSHCTSMLRKVLGPLFSKLRFLSVNPHELDKSVSNYELLSEHEKHTVLVNLLMSPGQTPLPDSICRNRKPRNAIRSLSDALNIITLTKALENNLSLNGNQAFFPTKEIDPIDKYNAPPLTFPNESIFHTSIETDVASNYSNQSNISQSTTPQLSSMVCKLVRPFLKSSKISLHFNTPETTKMAFVVSKNIKLLGVQLSSQQKQGMTGDYMENIKVMLHQVTSSLKTTHVTETHFCSTVMYGSQYTVDFQKPAIVYSNIQYVLTIHFNLRGTYVIPVRGNRVTSDGITFSCKGYSQGAEVIQALLYCLPIAS